MRHASEVKILETTGALEAHRTTIPSSRKTIRMMIDGVYADKELAVVRELATNAGDSHRRAGQEAPFYVHAPTQIKPEFFVRDYGVGMDHDKMVSTYIVLGASDKDTSDDEAGMWGIGALSPFAKADQYYITCYDGRVARHYGFGIAEDGVPTLYLLGEEENLEPCGVRVGFSVEEKDFTKFAKAIEQVSLGFGTQFETNADVRGAGDVAFEGEGWVAYLNCPLGAHWNVRQGGVIYPIDANKVEAKVDRRLTFILDCPIGSVQMASSREAIAYTDPVVDYLNQRVNAALDEVRQSINAKVADIAGVVEFFDAVKKLRPTFMMDPFVHPATGLTGPTIVQQASQVFFRAKVDASGLWSFDTLTSLSLTNPDRYSSAYMVPDVAPFLDAAREAKPAGKDWLTQSELRRVSRMARAYLDRIKQTEGLFLFNCDFTEAFWKATLPNLKRTPLSFEELRDAIPRRLVPQVDQRRQALKGLALAKAAGEQRPVFEIAERPDGAPVAWVTSERYRQRGGSLFKLARKFELGSLYIVAPGAVELMKQHKVPPLLDAIEAALVAKGSSVVAWMAAGTTLKEGYGVQRLVEFLKALRKADAEAHATLCRTRGEVAKLARVVGEIADLGQIEMSDEDQQTCKQLLASNEHGLSDAEPPVAVKVFKETSKNFQSNYFHPVMKFFDCTSAFKTKSQLQRAAKAVVQLEKLFPLSERFSTH